MSAHGSPCRVSPRRAGEGGACGTHAPHCAPCAAFRRPSTIIWLSGCFATAARGMVREWRKSASAWRERLRGMARTRRRAARSLRRWLVLPPGRSVPQLLRCTLTPPAPNYNSLSARAQADKAPSEKKFIADKTFEVEAAQAAPLNHRLESVRQAGPGVARGRDQLPRWCTSRFSAK